MSTAILTIAENKWFAICRQRMCLIERAIAVGVIWHQLNTISQFAQRRSQHTTRQVVAEFAEDLDYSSYRKCQSDREDDYLFECHAWRI